MIKSIHIKGFQKHEDLRIEFAPITTVVGKSDVGKSSIIRALKWACLNRPSGDEYVNWDADFAEVSVKAEKHTVTRRKGKGVNEYVLNGGEPYKAFGQGAVPQAIEKILNVDERNFSSQHDSPYWLSLTPGQVSKELNEIIDLSVIDSTMGNLASMLRKAKANAELTKSRLAEARKQRESLVWVKDAKIVYDCLVINEGLIASKRARAEMLAQIIGEWGNSQTKAQDAADAILVCRKAVSVGDLARGLRDRAGRLGTIVQGIAEAERKAAVSEDAAALAGHLAIIGERRKSAEVLGKLIQGMKSAQEAADDAAAEFKDAEAELHRNLKGKCPICGNVI